MIYVLYGTNSQKKSHYIKSLSSKDKEIITVSSLLITKELINNYACNISLFGDYPIVVFENIINQKDIIFNKDDLINLKNSKTTFVFNEDKLLIEDKNIYKKYSEVISFEEKTIKPQVKFNIFAISDSFSKRDKIGTWTLYCDAVRQGIDAEPIAGILFWKIKTMLISGSGVFSKEELKKHSSSIVSIYHKAHRGECDFNTSLEQFILLSLSK